MTIDRSVERLTSEIRNASSSWLDKRFDETPVVVALPRQGEIPWNNVFAWNSEDLAAEQLLAETCGNDRFLGITKNTFVNAGYLFDAPRFDFNLVQYVAKKHDWSDEFVDTLNNNLAKGDDIRHRKRGAAGWLVHQPVFLNECDELRRTWKQLRETVRPPLPLQRTPQLNHQPDKTKKARPSKQLTFQMNFDEFCDRWRLLGMITWELPDIDGPKWTEHYPGRPETPEGMTCQDTPFHFPLLSQDGLGELAEEEHDRLAEGHGFNDQSRWQTYAQLLRLSFWESVIDQRYAGYDRVKAYVTKKLEILAALLDLDVERTRKLRTQCNKLRSGQVSDLSNYR